MDGFGKAAALGDSQPPFFESMGDLDLDGDGGGGLIGKSLTSFVAFALEKRALLSVYEGTSSYPGT